MKHTVKPVKRLTCNCIWSSFQSSNKRHLILAGSKGSGKTTLLSQLFSEKTQGLTSWAEEGNAVYLKDNASEKTALIGSFDSRLTGFENKMRPVEEGFSSFGVACIESFLKSEAQWITIDEIGYLETQNAEYTQALEKLFEKKQVAAVVRKQNLPFLNKLCSRDDAFVVDLDAPYGNIGCVIMASGTGKRFGGNKLMADFLGKPLVSYVLDATEDIFSCRVVVTRDKGVADLCKKRGIDVVLHNLPDRSDTIRLGLEAVGDVERCMFAVADQPLLRYDTVRSLAIASKNCTDFIYRTAYDDFYGSPVIFPEWTFDSLKKIKGSNGGSVIIKKYPQHLRAVKVKDIYELKDVDYKADLDQLQKVNIL